MSWAEVGSRSERVGWASSSLPVLIPETRANKFAHATPMGRVYPGVHGVT